MKAADVFHVLFDPRGRINRKGLLILAVALLALQLAALAAVVALGMAADSQFAITLKVVFGWIALVAAIKRLHDTNRSGWWVFIAFVALIVWSIAVITVLMLAFGVSALQPGGAGHAAALVLTAAPTLAAALWLHLVPGDLAENGYGPMPSAQGFARPEDPIEALAA
ncbi:MAG: DUF805 domain-containing protein [Hyphomicrobiaceae bacterium]